MRIEPETLAASSGLLNGLDALATGTVDRLPAVETDLSSVFGLGKDDFFRLFLAQLKNQDPTRPVDDQEFIGQLAQFTMIETLQQVSAALRGSQLAQGSSLLGRHVSGLGVDGLPVDGVVERVVQTSAGLYLLVDGRAIRPEAVSQVTDEEPAPPAAA